MGVVSHTGTWYYTLHRGQGYLRGMARQQCGCGLNDYTLHRGRICKIIMYYSILHIYTHIRECTIDVESLSSSPIITSTITSQSYYIPSKLFWNNKYDIGVCIFGRGTILPHTS